MQSKASLQCSQNPTTGPYSEPVDCSPHTHTQFFKVHFNIIHLSVDSHMFCLQ
jgi:hypothetical protein